MHTIATELYKELEGSLPGSTAAKRAKWATVLLDQDFDMKDLSKLLYCEKKVATRFLWLLSELGELNPGRLYSDLPFLLELSDQIKHFDIMPSFATFWLIAGVPLENEAQAIDLLFHWVQSSTTNVTTKSRSILVLFKLTEKHPDLKNELQLCLEDQMDKNTIDFAKRAVKILNKLRA